jgi:hypothetical protein
VKRAIVIIAFIAGFLFGWTVLAPAASAGTGQCRVVKVLESAGFTGNNLRVAYGVVMRESKGQNLAEDSPWYSGALGIWQIQTSAHSGNRWWSRAAMLNPQRQSVIVYKYMTNKGTYWRPWGLTSDGRGLDTSHYGSWSSWQHYNWIWAPYKRYYDGFPRKCVKR